MGDFQINDGVLVSYKGEGKNVIIPSSVKAIEDNAFSGCNNLTIKEPLGSYAEKYAQDYGIKFEEI